MTWTAIIGRVLGYEDVSKIESARVSFGSSWAHATPALVIFGCLGLIFLTAMFYLRWQNKGHQATRSVLAFMRATAVCA